MRVGTTIARDFEDARGAELQRRPGVMAARMRDADVKPPESFEDRVAFIERFGARTHVALLEAADVVGCERAGRQLHRRRDEVPSAHPNAYV